MKKLAFIGGDKRSETCAEIFSQNGTECAMYGFENSECSTCATKCAEINDALCECDAVILPIPALDANGKIFAPYSQRIIDPEDVIKHITPGIPVICGNIGSSLAEKFESSGISENITDITDSEVYAIQNAVPSAEGAVIISGGVTGKAFCDSTVLICGYGKIGKYLAKLLQGFGSKVYVSARKNTDIALAKTLGFSPIYTDDIKNCGLCFDIIYNTVPYIIFDKNVLDSLCGKPTVIELASKPYGVGFSYLLTNIFRICIITLYSTVRKYERKIV